ncbi:Uncharacterised protein [uncultured archaeon]|nr:Uncharacterised protein [uncultured archaeon]
MHKIIIITEKIKNTHRKQRKTQKSARNSKTRSNLLNSRLNRALTTQACATPPTAIQGAFTVLSAKQVAYPVVMLNAGCGVAAGRSHAVLVHQAFPHGITAAE